MTKDEKFIKHLLEIFSIEAEEHLQSMTNHLIELEKTENLDKQDEIIEIIFRETHSLKGASRAVDQIQIETICQALESVLSLIKRKKILLKIDYICLFINVSDFLRELLINPGQTSTTQQDVKRKLYLDQLKTIKSKENDESKTYNLEEKNPVDSIGDQLKFSESSRIDLPIKKPMEEEAVDIKIPQQAQNSKVVKHDKVRVSASRLSAVLLQSEEMLSAKLSANQRTIDIKTANTEFEQWSNEWSKLLPLMQSLKINIPSSGHLEVTEQLQKKQYSVNKLINFFEWNNVFMKSLKEKYHSFKKSAEKDSLILDSMVDNLLDDMKKVMMFPFSSIFELFPKIVRDIANENNKKVQLILKGGDIEIDRRILEEIKDPFIHLIRNSVDHGIESPETRIKNNKAEGGIVKIEVFPKNHMVEIILSDDGGGIDPDEVRSAAYKNGTLSRTVIDKLTDDEIVSYVYHSGLSTSAIISSISGHGLGLAIVREKIEKLGGTITFKSILGKGTSFHIVIPLTIATLRGILVEVNAQTFIIPTMYVKRVVRVKADDIKTVENRETIVINGQVTSLVSLGDILKLPKTFFEELNFYQTVLLEDGGIQLAIIVDKILNEQEVLFKNLGKLLSRVNNIAGATVLGTGKAVPIINVSDLMKFAIKAEGFSQIKKHSDNKSMNRKYCLLVAEDSITTRTLLKNILETADYDVTTAVDGASAYALFKKNKYDAVISDVEMPRMSGFELTASIRSDSQFSELPIVLVTALESRSDKEKGIEVGADAYIVKSNFDQSNLLEVLNRLIIREE